MRNDSSKKHKQKKQQEKPADIFGWQELLSDYKLPVNTSVRDEALLKLKLTSGNANNVAAIISGDPALALRFFSEANKFLLRKNNEAPSLATAISLLGFPRVTDILKQAEGYNSTAFAHLNYFRQQLSVSLHAARQAEAWATANPYWPAGEMFWPALFQRAPLWALWFHGGEQMQEWQQQRMHRGGSSSAELEINIFGCTLKELCNTLCKKWYLPKLSQQSWQTKHIGTPEQWVKMANVKPDQTHHILENDIKLQRIFSEPAFAIASCNSLAEEAEWDWRSHRTSRLQKLLALLIHSKVEDGIAISHQASAATGKYLNGCLHPSVQLLNHYRKKDHLSLLDEPESATTLSIASPPTLKRPQNLTAKDSIASQNFLQALNELEQQAYTFNNIHDVMKFAIDVACDHIGMERVTSSLLNIYTKELRTYYSRGAENNPALKNFRHTLQRGDIFNKLLQKSSSIRMQKLNYEKVWGIIPYEFKLATNVNEFFMMSIFDEDKPIAIFYADRGNSKTKLKSEQYQHFKQLCHAVSQCLQDLPQA